MLQVVAGGRLRPAEELEAIFQGAGVDLARPTVCSCGSGVTAAILALALHQLSPANQVRTHGWGWGFGPHCLRLGRDGGHPGARAAPAVAGESGAHTRVGLGFGSAVGDGVLFAIWPLLRSS